MAEKKYYWLKLKEDFFRQPRMKKLRKVAGGDTYAFIYLKMQLLSLENEGMLFFEGIEDDFIEELALTIDEDPDNVRFTVLFLIDQGLMEEVRKDEYALPEAMKSIGSENASAERKRRSRENQKMLKERDSVTDVSQESHGDVTNCHTDIDIDIDKEKDIEIETEKECSSSSSIDDLCNDAEKLFNTAVALDAITEKLFSIWGVTPVQQDYDKVAGLASTNNGTAIDKDKLDLLEYSFEQAQLRKTV